MIFQQDLLSSINSQFRAQHNLPLLQMHLYLGNDLNTHCSRRVNPQENIPCHEHLSQRRVSLISLASCGSNDFGNGNQGSTTSSAIKGTARSKLNSKSITNVKEKETKYETIVKINGFMRKLKSKHKF